MVPKTERRESGLPESPSDAGFGESRQQRYGTTSGFESSMKLQQLLHQAKTNSLEIFYLIA
jgi:hypothetical protein